MRRLRLCAVGGAVAGLIAITGCTTEPTADRGHMETGPRAAGPAGLPRVDAGPAVPPLDLSDPSRAVWATTPPTIIDTRTFPVQIQPPVDGPVRLVKDHLPEHHRPKELLAGPPNDLIAGRESNAQRVAAVSVFSGLDRTGWTPPDLTIAVGPNHIVETVNQSIAWYTNGGVQQFRAVLGSQGSPGFFEDVGAQTFTFDPKCFYDHIAERFIVLALEVYTTTAFVTIAVSDDADPNGVWYKYRTGAVINLGGNTYWWDYPGLGYDEDAWYVTSNLFGLNNSGFAGAGYRVFDKSSMLSGGTASYATLRDGGTGSVQSAQQFGANNAAYFVSVQNSSALRVAAVRDPLTNPTLVTTTVSVPSFGSTSQSAVAGGGSIDSVDFRIMNVHARDGRLWTAHTIGANGRNKARWYEMDLGDWPGSGGVSLVQSGNVEISPEHDNYFPAIYTNDAGHAAMVFGASSASERVGMYITGRLTSDPLGEMGEPALVRVGTRSGSSGRWGDYYDIALDPNDGTTFWAVGQTDETGIGWDTWIARFTTSDFGEPIRMSFQGEPPRFVPPNVGADISVFVNERSDTLASAPTIVASADGAPDQNIAMTDQGDGVWTGQLPALDCGSHVDFAVVASSNGGVDLRIPDAGSLQAEAGSIEIVLADDFQSDTGWTVSGTITNAIFGLWERGVPAGDGSRGDPPADADGSGACYVTGNRAGPSDVDAGSTVLTSPRFDVADSSEPIVQYWRWYHNQLVQPADDVFLVEISNDDGATWTTLETVGPQGDETSGQWFQREFRIAEFVTPSDAMRVRFTAFDLGSFSGVEAGVDGFSIGTLVCGPSGCNAADLAEPFGQLDFFDVSAFLQLFGNADPLADLTDDGSFDFFDVSAFLAAFGAGCP